MSKACIPYTINVGGRLLDIGEPCVMGILNVTPDSFYTSVSPERSTLERDIVDHVERMIAEGAKIIDVGGCSTRPNSTEVSAEGEWERLDKSLSIIRRHCPDVVVSVDTFRADIAERCIKEYGVEIINDVYGGNDMMFDVVARHGVPYILTFNEPRDPSKSIMVQALWFFGERVQMLRDRGAKDIILDLGFGFNKTLEENFELMREMDGLKLLELPILVGISHKSMIFKTLGITPAESLNGTTVLNTISLMKGANILRVHEVKEAVESIKLIHNS